MKSLSNIFFLIVLSFFSSCSTDKKMTKNPSGTTNYLALGDSYTIGESVCASCNFPIQLQDALLKSNSKSLQTKIIARTGWTTTNLKSAVAKANTSNDYDLVTLSIGVNNQYQNKPFKLYEKEFQELVTIAITKAKGNKKNVIVISIPDYAFTPFGGSSKTVSTEIEKYNAFAANYCKANQIAFVNITPITQRGLTDTKLVASDGLHPSKEAYSEFVTLLLPKAKSSLGW